MNKTGIELIAQERKEQIEKHGLDDTHTPRKILTQAAIFCINNISLQKGAKVLMDNYPRYRLITDFYMSVQYKRDRMSDNDFQIEMLKIAGAFLAASIDKLISKE